MQTKQYRRLTPYDDNLDLEQLRWHTRESFDRTIASDGLELIDYTETDIDPRSIPKKTRDLFPNHKWREFTATAKLPAEMEALVASIKGHARSIQHGT